MARDRSEETRQRILTAAEECFNQFGYEGAGLAEICRSASVSRGAFYHHFPSKQAVFLALLERWLTGIDGELASARAGGSTVPEQLLRMAGVAQAVFAAGRGRLPLFLEFWTQAAHDPAVWQATIEPYHRYRDLFSGLIRAGIEEGSLRPVDPTLAAQVLLALALGLVLQGLLDPEGGGWSQVVHEGVEIFLSGTQAGQG
ncbi:MAG: TetR/AcrR family transcriptional regulator [Anaerolineae bacterium]|nr:TetR/AcrR family transcriptional regulator [Anaerolineae bacterium]